MKLQANGMQMEKKLNTIFWVERVADHCSNIAGCVIEMSHDSLHVHEYLDNVKAGSKGFQQAYDAYARKYALV